MPPGSGSLCRPIDLYLLCAVFLSLLAGIVSAHAPIGVGSNEEIANATLFPDPEKSYVLYTELHEGTEAQYYRFPLRTGQRLYGSLQVPGPGSMVPDLVIIGPGIVPSGELPSFVEVPAGSGAMVIPGEHPGAPSYEPFTPQPVYEVARFNVTVPKDSDYYLAVYGPEGCKYSLAPGYIEEFTASEWLLIPLSVVSIHLWEGQSPAYIFAPLVVVVIIGGLAFFMLFQRRRGSLPDPGSWLILIAGLLYLGGAGMTGLQTIHSVLLTGWDSGILLTLAFITGPLILGAYAVLLGVRSLGAAPSPRQGVAMVAVGLVGLLFWAGLLVGPLLAIVSGVATLAQRTKRYGPR